MECQRKPMRRRQRARRLPSPRSAQSCSLPKVMRAGTCALDLADSLIDRSNKRAGKPIFVRSCSQSKCRRSGSRINVSANVFVYLIAISRDGKGTSSEEANAVSTKYFRKLKYYFVQKI